MVEDLLTWPAAVHNHIDGADVPAASGRTFSKTSPASGQVLAEVARSEAPDTLAAVRAARHAQTAWESRTPVDRGDLCRAIALRMMDQRETLARVVHAETGKSLKDARGETGAAIEMGFFVAGEGRRNYGRTTTSAMAHRTAQTVRQPLGVAGLIIAANTPIANVAWKVFPALLCGNTAVLKASEDTPITAALFARIAAEAGLPAGVLNVVHGYGVEAGAPLVESPDVDVLSFTGSTAVGRWIQQTAGPRLTKICLELGGKNAFVVCDDADLDTAVRWAVLSAFSNAGQRCAAGSRLIVCDTVYDVFRAKLLDAVGALRVGDADTDDFGPVINDRYLQAMLASVSRAEASGAAVIAGGMRLDGSEYRAGHYMAPTVIENVHPDAELSQAELFGPITVLYRVPDLQTAIELANNSRYGLTAAIHTRSLSRAHVFAQRLRTGVVSINGGTFGSEPHLPFGGLRDSGTGFREAGTEALDVYSEWKTIYTAFDPLAI